MNFHLGIHHFDVSCLWLFCLWSLTLCHAMSGINNLLEFSVIIIPKIIINLRLLIHTFIQFFHSFLAPGKLLSISVISCHFFMGSLSVNSLENFSLTNSLFFYIFKMFFFNFLMDYLLFLRSILVCIT